MKSPKFIFHTALVLAWRYRFFPARPWLSGTPIAPSGCPAFPALPSRSAGARRLPRTIMPWPSFWPSSNTISRPGSGWVWALGISLRAAAANKAVGTVG